MSDVLTKEQVAALPFNSAEIVSSLESLSDSHEALRAERDEALREVERLTVERKHFRDVYMDTRAERTAALADAARLREALVNAKGIIAEQRAGVSEDEPCARCSTWPHKESCAVPDELSEIENAIAAYRALATKGGTT